MSKKLTKKQIINRSLRRYSNPKHALDYVRNSLRKHGISYNVYEIKKEIFDKFSQRNSLLTLQEIEVLMGQILSELTYNPNIPPSNDKIDINEGDSGDYLYLQIQEMMTLTYFGLPFGSLQQVVQNHLVEDIKKTMLKNGWQGICPNQDFIENLGDYN